MISEEAEEIALELAGGREISAKEQQDLMWDSGTVSVWDLEAMEQEAEQNDQAFYLTPNESTAPLPAQPSLLDTFALPQTRPLVPTSPETVHNKLPLRAVTAGACLVRRGPTNYRRPGGPQAGCQSGCERRVLGDRAMDMGAPCTCGF